MRSKVTRPATGSKPAGGGTPAPASPASPAPVTPARRRTNLLARQRAFQESETNRRVWELIDLVREWRELHLEFKAWLRGRDPAEEILLDFAIVPPGVNADFADDAVFAEALEGLDAISAKVRECIGLMCGELPCRPTSTDRRAAA